MQRTELIEVVRAGLVESAHYVSIAVVDQHGKLLASWGNPELVTFLRSSAKPFQAIALVESGAAEAFDLDDRDLALICASHSGMDMHLSGARRLLEKIGEEESVLLCGVHPPLDTQSSRALIRADEHPTSLHNNCSGKHIGMLCLSKHLGADLVTYLDPQNPAQLCILKTVSQFSGVPAGSIRIGVDGCSAPTFALPLHCAARAYAELVAGEQTEEHRRVACRRIFEAMTTHPELIAGPGRFDTAFMQAVQGRMVSKGGAEGYQSIGIPPNVLADGSPAIGVAIKVHDGDHRNHQAAALAALAVVGQLGGLRSEERANLQDFDERELRNLRGSTVGSIRINPNFIQEFRIADERL